MDSKKGQYIMQYVTAASVSLLVMTTGIGMGWTSPTLPKLEEGDFGPPMSESQKSWVASMSSMGAIAGPVFGAFIADYFGRKIGSLMLAVPFIISWTMISFGSTYVLLLIARFIAGLSIGATFTISPMYLCEVSSNSIRGIIGNFFSISLQIGILLVYVIGPAFSINTTAKISLAFPVIFVLTFIWLPESPHYLIMKRKESKAKEALRIFRRSDDVDEELETIKGGIKPNVNTKEILMDLVRIQTNRKALLIVLGIIAFQQANGLAPIIAYAHTIFKESESILKASTSGIIYGCVSLVSALVGSFLVDTWGRKPMLLFSAIASIVPLVCLGTYFYLKSIDYEHLENITLLPTVSVIVFNLCFSVGFAGLPYIIISEIFPTDVKALACCIVSLWGSAGQVVAVKLYQILADAFGLYTVYYIYATCCLLSAIFIIFCVPETKGKSILEIQKELRNEKYTNIKS